MDEGERRQARTSRRVSGKIEERILALRSDGLGMLKISKTLGSAPSSCSVCLASRWQR